MSQKIVQEINNLVDKEKSEYYFVNKRKRLFWHSRSQSISCRVRNKNNFNHAPEMAINIRAFLLGEEKYFFKVVSAVMRKISAEDRQELRNYVYSLFEAYTEERKAEIDKKMGLIIGSLSEEEVKGALNLENVVSCRLLGYEKELFYLKCFSWGILPVFMLRVLYHTKYAHLKLKRILEYEEYGYELTDPYKGLEFEFYLDKIRFL